MRCTRRRRRGRLQWIALASPSEVAGGRIISFLLMSSTSWEGGESITPLCSSFLFFPPIFPLVLLAATVAASLRGTYMYYISDKRHNNLPLHTHTCSFSLSLWLCVCVSHTLFCLRLSFYFAGSIGRDRCHVAIAFSEMRFPFCYLKQSK